MDQSQDPARPRSRATASRFDPKQVHDPLFQQYPRFFDARDLVQVKYEMLRAHHVQGEPVARVARRFGFSRQTFYATDAAFRQARWWGLVPAKTGPRGPRKVTPACAQFLEAEHRARPEASWADLAAAVAQRFGIVVHPRTVQRLFLKKKHPTGGPAPESPPVSR